LRITVQLTDSEDGRQLKSLRFDRAFTSLLGVQDQIADETAAALATSRGGLESRQGTAAA